MSLQSSFRVMFEVLKLDKQWAAKGGQRGWYALQHYRARLFARTGLGGGVTQTSVPLPSGRRQLSLRPMYYGGFCGVFIHEEYSCESILGFKPQRILDLGANIGMTAVYFSGVWPDAQYLCVEPDPRNLELLRLNLAQNSLPAQVVEGAVGARPGRLELLFDDDPTCSTLLTSGLHGHTRGIEVEVTTVEEVLDRAGWDDIDLLKIDIEGAEEDLLSGSPAWLDRVKAIIIEIHPNTTPEKIAGYLKKRGFILQELPVQSSPVYLGIRNIEASSRQES